MRSRITLLPEFRTLEEFRDVLCRSAFHLGHADPESFAFIVDDALLEDARSELDACQVPDNFDGGISQMVADFADSVQLLSAGTPQADRLGLVSDIIIVWDQARFDNSEWMVERGRRTDFVTLFDVDRQAVRMEGSHWAMLAGRLSAASLSLAHQRFRRMIAAIGPHREVYLFGTGPSIDEAKNLDCSDGIRIVCNTVIMDDELMTHLDPQILTFADPIFHFGPSRYAARFREELRRALVKYPRMWVVMPHRYVSLMESVMPEHADRFVGVPMLRPGGALSLNLNERYAVRPYPNVLTLLMLPLGATLGKRIGLAGFDGRKPSEDYFWTHGKAVQNHGDLPGIQKVHPAFFEIDYSDYYKEHVDTVERFFRDCEGRGIVVEGVSHSFMPPLRARMRFDADEAPSWVVPSDLIGHDGEIIISVDPDWNGDFGHYGPWFKALREESAKSQIPAVSLASRGIYADDDPDVLPAFSYPTVNARAMPLYAPKFEEELRSTVEAIANKAPGAGLILTMYTANFWHLPAFIRVCTEQRPQVRAAVNLMRSHVEIVGAASSQEDRTAWTHVLREILKLAARAGVTVTVDTEELAAIVNDLTGVQVRVLPMATASSVVPRNEEGVGDPVRIFCPALSQEAKGILEFSDAAAAMLSGPLADSVEIQMRSVDQPGGTPRAIVRRIELAEEAGVSVLHGTLSNEDYAKAFEAADIVVIPYRFDSFRTRTSSVVIDAMRAAKPVVVASGTWSADLVAESRSGVLFSSGDKDDLLRAMTEAVNRLGPLSERARDVVDEVSSTFSMAVLADFLVDLPQGDEGLSGEDQLRLDDLAASLLVFEEGRLAGERAKGRLAEELQGSVLYREGKVEKQEARIEELERAIAHRDGRFKDLRAAREHLAEAHARLEERVAATTSVEEDLRLRDRQLQECSKARQSLEAKVQNLEKTLFNRAFAAVKRRLRR